MHPIVYYIIFFLATGALGMALGSRKAPAQVKKQRWLKYFTYILFTGVVVLGMFCGFFKWAAIFISLAAMAELVIVNHNFPGRAIKKVTSQIILLLVTVGFVCYAFTFQSSFLLFIYLQVMVFDGFCQITGQLFGKHQLAPSISPAKTIEGLAGGWFFCTGTAVATATWVHLSLTEAAIFGLATGGICFCGDITASWYKRVVKVKDYSNWLPGQGGFLDRFDSFLLTGAFYFLLYLLIFKDYFSQFIL